MSQLDFTKELEAACLAADGAKSILISYFGNLHDVQEKDQAGLVSEADRESEKFISEILLKEFPQYSFLGEESGFNSGKTKFTQNLHGDCWIVDPLDGTTNYVHGLPIFCISIGLQVGGELVVGVVDAPLLNQRFTAIKGRGAFLNGKKISVSKRNTTDRILLATGFSVSRPEMLEEQVRMMERMLRLTRGIRRAGSAAYDLCMVASGVYDGFWESNLKPWDTAAGALLITEAGGLVSNFSGKSFSPDVPSIVVGSKFTYEILKKEIHELIE